MISAEQQRLLDLSACLVKFEVARSVVELLVLDDEWLGIAQVTEDVVVEEEAALIHTAFLLALAAHPQDWFKPVQLVHSR